MTTTTTAAVHPLTRDEATALAALIYDAEIPLVFAIDEAGVTHLCPLEPLSTELEVFVLRAAAAHTDRFVWHREGPPT
jgi:hypothetical protein